MIKGHPLCHVCFPDFCFSNRKAYDLYSPENLSGDHRKHRGKCENRGFSPALQMGQFHLKIRPKNEKTDRRSGRRRIEKMVVQSPFFLIFQQRIWSAAKGISDGNKPGVQNFVTAALFNLSPFQFCLFSSVDIAIAILVIRLIPCNTNCSSFAFLTSNFLL